MARTRVMALFGFVLLGAACGGLPSAQPPASAETANVTGVVDRGPVTTCPVDEPCDPRPVANMLVFSRRGVPDVTVRLAGDGSFALHLEPGDYAVAAAPPTFGGKIEPPTVHVPPQGTVFLQLRIVHSV